MNHAITDPEKACWGGSGQGPPFPLRGVSVKASGRLGWLFSEISIKEILWPPPPSQHVPGA